VPVSAIANREKYDIVIKMLKLYKEKLRYT